MSLLPQRKKPPEEIAQLREDLGIPMLPPVEELAPQADPPAMDTPVVSHKPWRSLRKSELATAPAMPPPAPSADSPLPDRRHSDQEIQDLRRREALALLTPVVNPKLAAAHPALLVPGYLAALAGAAAIYFYQQPLRVSAACVAASLLIAGFIALTKPISRHHAAFIAAISLLVMVFGALHYFPHLRHGT